MKITQHLSYVWNLIKKSALTALRIVIAIGTIIIIFGVMRWLGLKGLLGIVLGITVCAYLILSKNPMLLGIIKLSQSDWYVDELAKTKDEKEEEPKKID